MVATAAPPDRDPRDRGSDRPQVWFAPNDDLARGPNHDRYLNHDFVHLFDPKPAWDAKIDVFKISPLMGSAVGPADELGRINAFLKDHRIALSVDTGGVTLDNPLPTPGECGYGVEGMARPGRNAINFRRLKSLGIEVPYVTLDEPLTCGHYYNRKRACRYSISRVGCIVMSPHGPSVCTGGCAGWPPLRSQRPPNNTEIQEAQRWIAEHRALANWIVLQVMES
ncbi:MAG TPA: hypothetical protein VFO27_18760 [Bryobacteraceae bacterium]|nr:hypothetical protein [Bryobacteraceae bacterium]